MTQNGVCSEQIDSSGPKNWLDAFHCVSTSRDENTPVFRAHLVSTWDTIEARLYDEAVLHYFDLR